MRDKGFGTLLTVVMITVPAGCDNVAFGGVHVELRPPSAPSEGSVADGVERSPPEGRVELEPILYLVRRGDGSNATLLPIAQLAAQGYEEIPDSTRVPDLLSRFSVGRFEPGTEYTLFSRGLRVGTFVAAGPLEFDVSTCRVRPAVRGRVEILPEASGQSRFLAVSRSDALGFATLGAYELTEEDAAVRGVAVRLAQQVIPAMGVAVPPSLFDIERDLQTFAFGSGDPSAVAVSYVYGDDLVVGPSQRLAFSLFILGEQREGRYEPVFAWYQRFDQNGKAFPRLVGTQDLIGSGEPDAVFEVFGESSHWLAILGPRDGEYRVLYEDPCGVPVATAGVRTFP